MNKPVVTIDGYQPFPTTDGSCGLPLIQKKRSVEAKAIPTNMNEDTEFKHNPLKRRHYVHR